MSKTVGGRQELNGHSIFNKSVAVAVMVWAMMIIVIIMAAI